MPNPSCVIVWFRKDLRLSDNPALAKAGESGLPVLPLFILDEEGEGEWPDGAASRWWLHHSLARLGEQLESLGSRLILRRGSSWQVLSDLVESEAAVEVYWNRRYEPAIVDRDTEIKKRLADIGAQGRSFNGSLLHSPPQIANKSGSPFKVFTPFWKHLKPRSVRQLSDAPKTLEAPQKWPQSDPLEAFDLLPEIPWDEAFYDHWTPGEKGARERLSMFAKQGLARYDDQRDLPAEDGVSRLSPHLHFGEISPVQLWRELESDEAEPYLRQIVWREFAHHLLFHFPDTPSKPLRPEFEDFPWKKNQKALRAWKKGQTGYPIVDAGMRQLWTTGWMHNRVRMIASSFLVKHLLIPWQEGAAWFWDTLVDADLANNTMGWQWIGGCGADAAPYFRIFNPITQGQRFDSEGEYVRRWVPELAKLPNKYLFAPWEASEEELESANVTLGETYPRPIVGHAEGRQAALDAYQRMKEKKEEAS
ncbi:deoxyribodipyrimidine photo-lyase [Pelagicoccus sp. SDUM812003]|uniref:cryptochrome/photolyase family protein n=1 Tax=Pelagicoccus sp. SDUM812003 TaxID=3041267 RepID=UPI00280CD72E|nr:deoxyribodipyrimidine photo-lyase [Pelagicoccus sp. SDUM812003]MDQ8203666.1 deoxyribodipyrimidine photo-lyase [Pelagicoccus sp. SDUM812003]